MGCLNKWIRCVRLECWLWLLLVVVVEKNRGGVLVAMVKGTDSICIMRILCGIIGVKRQ